VVSVHVSTDEDPENIRGNRGGGAVVSDRIPEIIRGNREQMVEQLVKPIRANQSPSEPISRAAYR
jgi:hypothetical protein